MSSRISGRGALGRIVIVVVGVLSPFASRDARAATVPRSILKTFFESGDKPTGQQFATLIDSSVNLVDDRKLIGLKVYNPQLNYSLGDTVVFKRLGIGDTTPQSPLGAIEFAPASELTGSDAPTRDMATDFAGHDGFLAIQLQDAAGQVYNGYFQLSMDTPSGLPNDPPAIHVDYVVYNDVPGEPITMTLVPEPAGLGVLAVCSIAMWSGRRRRRREGCSRADPSMMALAAARGRNRCNSRKR